MGKGRDEGTMALGPVGLNRRPPLKKAGSYTIRIPSAREGVTQGRSEAQSRFNPGQGTARESRPAGGRGQGQLSWAARSVWGGQLPSPNGLGHPAT